MTSMDKLLAFFKKSNHKYSNTLEVFIWVTYTFFP